MIHGSRPGQSYVGQIGELVSGQITSKTLELELNRHKMGTGILDKDLLVSLIVSFTFGQCS
jgi:hypothetical protein